VHARDGLDVALHGGTPDVLAGEAHVNVVAEVAAAKHLAELVLSLHDTLHGSLAYPPRSVEEASLGTRIALGDTHEHAQDMLSRGRATIC
jgi:hypothetical protein